jgi:predicted nucleic acid-binding protein
MTRQKHSNTWVAILGDDPVHREWSQRELDRALINHQLAINPVVYAEISPPYATQAALDEVLAIMKITIEPMSPRALFLAGKAHHAYRRRGGTQARALPDFLVGAQAAALDVALITRDVSRYQTYFPKLRLIAPEEKLQ